MEWFALLNRSGEPAMRLDVQLFTGPRMKPVRVGVAVCQAARQVRLDFPAAVVTLDDAIEIRGADALDAFAIRDGFRPPERLAIRPWDYMARWWCLTHPDQPVFAGVMVDWGDTFEAVV